MLRTLLLIYITLWFVFFSLSSLFLLIVVFILFKVVGTCFDMFRKLRNFIDDQNARFAEEKKAAKSKVSDAKEKVRLHKVFCFFLVLYRYNCKLSHGVHIVMYMLSTGKKS